jgi:hypothetical protein
MSNSQPAKARRMSHARRLGNQEQVFEAMVLRASTQAFAVIREALYMEFQDLLVELLNDAQTSAGLNCTTRELALCLAYAIRGFKEMAFDSVEFRRMIRIQVRLVACAVGRPARRATSRSGRAARPSLLG